MTKRSKMQFYPSAITISGSDSGGGAGVAADLRTFNALGVFGTCAITAVAAANPVAIRRIDALPGQSVAAQIDAVMEKIAVRYGKTGVLFSAETVCAVADSIKKHQLKVVCDPVIFSADNSRLLQDDALEALQEKLLLRSSWITPGIREAELLADMKISSTEDMLAAAATLGKKYSAAIYLRNTAAGNKTVTDVIFKDGKLYTLNSPSVNFAPFAGYGTGCTLSASLAAMLTLDLPWKQAVCESRAFVYGSQMQSVEIGAGVITMYPPSEDTIHLIKLAEVENA